LSTEGLYSVRTISRRHEGEIAYGPLKVTLVFVTALR
jgi:hypothetical protein